MKMRTARQCPHQANIP